MATITADLSPLNSKLHLGRRRRGLRTWYLRILGLLALNYAGVLEFEWVPLTAAVWGVVSILGLVLIRCWMSKVSILDQLSQSNSTIEFKMPTRTSRISPKQHLRREIVTLIACIVWLVILQTAPIFKVLHVWMLVSVGFSFVGAICVIRVAQAVEESRSPSTDHVVITNSGILWLGLPVPEFQRWKNLKQAIWIKGNDVSGLKLELKNDRSREFLPAVINFRGIEELDREKLLKAIGTRIEVVHEGQECVFVRHAPACLTGVYNARMPTVAAPSVPDSGYLGAPAQESPV